MATTKITNIPGIRLATVATAIKYKNRDDLLLIEIAKSSTVGSIFTKNACMAAPIQVAKQHVELYQSSQVGYLIVNAGNANAATGAGGVAVAKSICQAIATKACISCEQVLPFSTGVIGEPLPTSPIINQTDELFAKLDIGNWQQAAAAILTTDLSPKAHSISCTIGGKVVTISGIAKGSGMMQPNMATMLSFIATDAKIDQQLLQQMLQQTADLSFNAISVDGDTSTNDAVVLIATGKSGIAIDDKLHSNDYKIFATALNKLFLQLATAIVKDGEGASKFVQIDIEQALDLSQAKQLAQGIANSPLIKTALFASDPNWGRIIMAIGNHCKPCYQDKITIAINGYNIVKNGIRSPTYDEATAQQKMTPKDITLTIGVGQGECKYTYYTCDLSYDYIKINAEYRS